MKWAKTISWSTVLMVTSVVCRSMFASGAADRARGRPWWRSGRQCVAAIAELTPKPEADPGLAPVRRVAKNRIVVRQGAEQGVSVTGSDTRHEANLRNDTSQSLPGPSTDGVT